jgi:hypothetical protein
MKLKLLTTLFVLGSLSFASNVFAAGPCVHLRTPEQCISYPTGECFWDEADQRCENRSNDEDACSRYHSYYSCTNSPYNCFWDNDDQRCERRF